MSVFIGFHAAGATLALLLGAVNFARRPRGDLAHRRIGAVWVVAMYWTVISSFFIRELHPGHFSWIHGLSVFTFVTLSLGLWGAVTGRIALHRGNMIGSWLGTVGAFLGAVTVPQRAIPKLAVAHPWTVSVAAFVLLAMAMAVTTAAQKDFRPRDARVPAGR